MSFRTLLVAGIFAVAFAVPAIAEAADVSALQTALGLARDDLNREQARHDAARRAVDMQQKIVDARRKELADETSRLDKLKKDAQEEDKQYHDAKQKFDKAQANLDAAWGK